MSLMLTRKRSGKPVSAAVTGSGAQYSSPLRANTAVFYLWIVESDL